MCIIFPAASFAQMDSIIAIAKDAGAPAIEVVHVKKGKITSLHWGVKKAGTTDSITNETAFQAASLTKVVTAYAFFKLYDKGLINLDTPLYHYYAYDRLANEPGKELITARMVLTHRTGLLNWEGAVSTKEWRESPLHLQFTPGTKYMYSGEGYYFLQLVMEKVSGKSFQHLIESEVFAPLGMHHSQILWKDTLLENIAFGHYEDGKPRNLGKYTTINAAYSMYTTADDYTLFIQKALNRGVGLRKTTHQLMISKANEVQKAEGVSPDDAHVPIALGMRLQYNEAGTWLWHTGSNPGFRCFFITNPKTGESLTAFLNTDSGFEAMPRLLALFLGNKQTFWAYTWRQGELD